MSMGQREMISMLIKNEKKRIDLESVGFIEAWFSFSCVANISG